MITEEGLALQKRRKNSGMEENRTECNRLSFSFKFLESYLMVEAKIINSICCAQCI